MTSALQEVRRGVGEPEAGPQRGGGGAPRRRRPGGAGRRPPAQAGGRLEPPARAPRPLHQLRGPPWLLEEARRRSTGGAEGRERFRRPLAAVPAGTARAARRRARPRAPPRPARAAARKLRQAARAEPGAPRPPSLPDRRRILGHSSLATSGSTCRLSPRGIGGDSRRRRGRRRGGHRGGGRGRAGGAIGNETSSRRRLASSARRRSLASRPGVSQGRERHRLATSSAAAWTRQSTSPIAWPSEEASRCCEVGARAEAFGLSLLLLPPAWKKRPATRSPSSSPSPPATTTAAAAGSVRRRPAALRTASQLSRRSLQAREPSGRKPPLDRRPRGLGGCG